MNKTTGNTLILRILILLLSAGLTAATLRAQPQRATPEQWRSDIDYVATELPKSHPNPFAHTTLAAFQEQLDALKQDVPQLTDAGIAIRLQQAVATMDDAHTEVDTRISPTTYYPLRVDFFSDGFYVTRTLAEAKPACGAKLVAIDGIGMDEVLARMATVISHENEPWLLARAPVAIARAEVLEALGITLLSDRAMFTFENGGMRFDLELHPVGLQDANAIFSPPASTDGWPLYVQSPRQWYSWDAARGLMYVKYNACREDFGRPFATFAKEILAIADHNLVTNFVVDVRNNSGGNSSVAQPLIDGIRQRTQLRGRTWVIIGRETFSSGLLNALDLSNTGCKVVGESTGGKPNAYGEVVSFKLPNSGITVFHSTRYFNMVPGDPPSMDPTVAVAIAASDFFSRRDPVRESITNPQGVQGALSIPGPANRRRSAARGDVRSCPE
ncbi:MAG TPA: hypothetical protein VEZ11_03190 [Thermoanaerobaculia bacterium]|nr:hypothetical protein [Thermoanaerobaculia bacterium]